VTVADAAVIRVFRSIKEIERERWDSCANPGWPSERPLGSPPATDSGVPYNPFISHDFLWALEESGSASARAGWAPQHLTLEDGSGALLGAMPAYLKSHSQGEYVFDHGWADAFERAGGRYYPKLQASVPFTPATGRRLLVPPGAACEHRRRTLATGATELARRLNASSVHVTFMTEAECRPLAEAGYLMRTDRQFHFVNPGYRDFDDFLDALASRKRKAIRRERRDAVADGIEIVALTGAAITEADWDAFFGFYMDTGSRKWGRPYLNRKFFSLVGERMADRILLILARRGRRAIAGALNFIGSETLFGRYWGATERLPFLHFELCYYQAMEWGIAHGMKCVEAGAQGEHKIARGYQPVTTYSAHWIADPTFRKAVADYLRREQRHVARESEALAEMLPFREDDSGER
jgi:predicted N-acyltransferase